LSRQAAGWRRYRTRSMQMAVCRPMHDRVCGLTGCR
jgi:hypothetical protein